VQPPFAFFSKHRKKSCQGFLLRGSQKSGVCLTVVFCLRFLPAFVVFSKTRGANPGEQLQAQNLAWALKYTAIGVSL
jgi:hypothetical protein